MKAPNVYANLFVGPKEVKKKECCSMVQHSKRPLRWFALLRISLPFGPSAEATKQTKQK